MHQRDCILSRHLVQWERGGRCAQGAGLLSENKRSAAAPEFATIHKPCLTAANNFQQVSSSLLINHWWIELIKDEANSWILWCFLSLGDQRDSSNMNYEQFHWWLPIFYVIGSIWKGQHKRCIKGCYSSNWRVRGTFLESSWTLLGAPGGAFPPPWHEPAWRKANTPNKQKLVPSHHILSIDLFQLF